MNRSRLTPFVWPLILLTLAVAIYGLQVHKGMADFAVYRRAAGRAMAADNLYRPEDGHYQYKYFPAFAFAAAPFALVDDLAARTGSRFTAGALVGLAVFVKPYALILLPWLWLVGGLPGLAAHGAVLAVGLLMPSLVYGWEGNVDQLRHWYRTVTDTSAPNLLKEENISFATTWAKWIGAGQTASRLAATTSVVALASVAFMMSRRRGVREPAYLE